MWGEVGSGVWVAHIRPDAQPPWDPHTLTEVRDPWGLFLEESASSDSKVILAVRKAENLKRLLYVSCNPRAAMSNFVE